MLGPVRFEHIQQCAREVCHSFRIQDELEDGITTLRSLDDMLHLLRTELAELRGTQAPKNEITSDRELNKKHDYQPLLDAKDLAKTKKLISARENSIKSVKGLLRKTYFARVYGQPKFPNAQATR